MYIEDMCGELSSQLMSDINCRVWIDSDTIHSNGILVLTTLQMAT
jgi:hypothetical protein